MPHLNAGIDPWRIVIFLRRGGTIKNNPSRQGISFLCVLAWRKDIKATLVTETPNVPWLSHNALYGDMGGNGSKGDYGQEKDIPKKLLIVNPSVHEFTEAQFAEELKTIQDSKSINDIINFRQISPERIKLIPKAASAFYTEYFANGAAILKNELEQTEKGDKVFE